MTIINLGKLDFGIQDAFVPGNPCPSLVKLIGNGIFLP